MEQQKIRCPIHRKEVVITSCTQSNCSKLPLICPLCPDIHNDHYQNLVSLPEWINKISKAAQEGQKVQKQIREIAQIDQVLKWCEDDQMHFRKVEEHCKAQKALIAEDINYIRDLFNEKCYQTQILLEQELEDFVLKYKEQFKLCKQSVDDSYNLYRNCNGFINSNNLIMKLQQSTSREAQDLTIQLKKLLKKDNDPVEQIRQGVEKITEMTYNLPVYSFQEGIEQLCIQMSDILSNHLKTKLNIQKPKRQVSPIKYVSKNLHKQYSLPQENINLKSPRMNTSPIYQSKGLIGAFTDMILKPLKKYQLDFPVSSVEVVAQSIFALTCSNDPHLRIFDISQKRINTFSAHQNPIFYMSKSHDQSQALQVNNNNSPMKTTTYLFTLSTDLFIVWSFESSQPQIYHKYQTSGNITSLCYLQDNSCTVLGDKDGGIEIYNFQTQTMQQNNIKGKHSKQISAIVLLKKNDKFAVGSYDQSISIWKMIYSGNFESAYCECLINCNGQVQLISQLQSNLLLIGTLEGSLKIVNSNNQCVIMESDQAKNTTSIVDFLVLEDPRKEQVYSIALPQNQRTLRMWKLQNSDNGWLQSENKMEVALSISDNMSRSKLQIVSMPQSSSNPLVLMANENNKELLVYEIIIK